MDGSVKKSKKGIALMLISSVCVCTGQLFWKLSGGSFSLYLFLGFLLYITGALLMLVAYKYGSLSVLQPMLGMNYVFALVLAVFVLGENITLAKSIGIALVTLSVILIGGAKD